MSFFKYHATAAMAVRHQAMVQTRLTNVPNMNPTRPSISVRPAAQLPITLGMETMRNRELIDSMVT